METTLNQQKTKSLQEEIRRLVGQKNAIILAHNYQPPEIQDVADLCGDSLELSIKASKTDADVIVFCGVHFMAETASILCPDKKILLPKLDAGCPMADMITAKTLGEIRQKRPELVVISYVNTTADVKAQTDICCTSANVIQVVNSVDPAMEIFMTPDKNLAQYARKNSDRRISFWDGYCPIHNSLTPGQVMKVKKAHPEAVFLAHPECPPEVLALADLIKSTSGMLSFVSQSDKKEFIIGTEIGIIHPMSKANPGKMLIPADPDMICRQMKKISLTDMIGALNEMQPEVKVPEDIRLKAKGAVDRMLAISAGLSMARD
ncbi:Quinolinate synthase A [uncultured Desulfobacterium sp.]|uniref:Quinolinate synthase n=1 Tax=uncultured Desulfobacterium sp. TaxID=201089 RepID=A0A445MWG6_9BACT|nr:Quinolinate synthase A [uncultured Desulfobacterium sp.]